MYLVIFTKQAAKDARKLKAAGLEVKAKLLIKLLRENPFQNPPAYEALVGRLSGLYSRRINLQHRLVYQFIPGVVENANNTFEGTVKVIRMWTHYEGL